MMKLNVDGYSRGTSSMSVVEGVLHDHSGVVLVAFGSFLGHQSILFAELLAMLEGLDLVLSLGLLF